MKRANHVFVTIDKALGNRNVGACGTAGPIKKREMLIVNAIRNRGASCIKLRLVKAAPEQLRAKFIRQELRIFRRATIVTYDSQRLGS